MKDNKIIYMNSVLKDMGLNAYFYQKDSVLNPKYKDFWFVKCAECADHVQSNKLFVEKSRGISDLEVYKGFFNFIYSFHKHNITVTKKEFKALFLLKILEKP